MQARPLLLYVTDAEMLGGAEGYLRTLLLHAAGQGRRVGLVLPPRPATQPLVDLARAHAVEVYFLDVVHHEGLSAGGIARSVATLRRLKPTIVHFVLASPRRCAEMVLAAAIVGVRRRLITFQLVTPVPSFGRVSGALRRLNRGLQYRTVHQGIAVSAGNRKLLICDYDFPAARLALIPNAVDTETFCSQPADPKVRAAWGIPPHALLIGVVGRLSRQKGHRVLFEALPAIWEVFPEMHVVLLGQGDLEATLRADAEQIDSAGRIHFVGQVQDMPQALVALDLFVLPSLYEGLSFAILEAMATGCAIVATAVDGTVDVIENGQNGLLVPPGQSRLLADACIRLLLNEQQRQQFGRAAQATAIKRFDQRQMLHDTFALYRTTVA